MQGSWQLVSLTGKSETDKASGNKLVFEEETQRLLFGSLLTGRHREQFGRLVVKRGKTKLFDGEVKLIRTDRHPEKRDAAGTSKYQVVPTSRLDSQEFGTLYGHIGVTVDAEFYAKVQAAEEKGNGSPKADDDFGDDDNVQPESTAAAMKANARKKLAAAAA